MGRTWMLALWLGIPEDSEMRTGTEGLGQWCHPTLGEQG